MHKTLKTIFTHLVSISTVNMDRLRREIDHSINTLEWLKQLAQKRKPKMALQIAALLHDVNRYFKRKIKGNKFTEYKRYKKKHALSCAKIALKILEDVRLPQYKKEVFNLIKDHEFRTGKESDVLMSADSLSFFDTNLFYYYNKNGGKTTPEKINFMYQRLDKRNRGILKKAPLDFKKCPELNKLFKKAIKRLI